MKKKNHGATTLIVAFALMITLGCTSPMDDERIETDPASIRPGGSTLGTSSDDSPAATPASRSPSGSLLSYFPDERSTVFLTDGDKATDGSFIVSAEGTDENLVKFVANDSSQISTFFRNGEDFPYRMGAQVDEEIYNIELSAYNWQTESSTAKLFTTPGQSSGPYEEIHLTLSKDIFSSLKNDPSLTENQNLRRHRVDISIAIYAAIYSEIENMPDDALARNIFKKAWNSVKQVYETASRWIGYIGIAIKVIDEIIPEIIDFLIDLFIGSSFPINPNLPGDGTTSPQPQPAFPVTGSITPSGTTLINSANSGAAKRYEFIASHNVGQPRLAVITKPIVSVSFASPSNATNSATKFPEIMEINGAEFKMATMDQLYRIYMLSFVHELFPLNRITNTGTGYIWTSTRTGHPDMNYALDLAKEYKESETFRYNFVERDKSEQHPVVWVREF